MQVEALRALRLEAALLSGNRREVGELARELAGGGLGALERTLTPTLDRIGTAWEAGNLSLAQVYMAGRLCEELAEAVAPAAARTTAKGPRLGVAVLRDRHVLGKRLVIASLRAAGHDPEDLGHSLEPDELAQLSRARGLDIVLVSTLMLRSALAVRLLMEALGTDGRRPQVIVGGAPFRIDPQLWRQVGADAFGKSCTDAPALVERLGAYLP